MDGLFLLIWLAVVGCLIGIPVFLIIVFGGDEEERTEEQPKPTTARARSAEDHK